MLFEGSVNTGGHDFSRAEFRPSGAKGAYSGVSEANPRIK